MVQLQYKNVIDDFSILRLRADNGKEFIVQDMKRQWEDIGTWLQLSVAYTHNQNGVVERTIRVTEQNLLVLAEGLPGLGAVALAPTMYLLADRLLRFFLSFSLVFSIDGNPQL
jgi:hypothetical protein